MTTLHEIKERLSNGTERLWWKWRFLDAVVQASRLQQDTIADDLNLALECFLGLATEDPDWAIAKLADNGPDAHGLAMLLESRLESALSQVHTSNRKAEAMLRASMLIASATWSHGKRNELWARAWTELQRVDPSERGEDWRDFALSATAHVDYPSYRELAQARVSEVGEPFWCAQHLASAIPVAAHHKDWPMFDTWVASYKGLPEALRRDHQECAVLNLEGLRALEEGRVGDAVHVMEQIVALAPTLTFLSNEELSTLSKQLRVQGLALQLCDQLDSITNRRDWRLIPKKT